MTGSFAQIGTQALRRAGSMVVDGPGARYAGSLGLAFTWDSSPNDKCYNFVPKALAR